MNKHSSYFRYKLNRIRLGDKTNFEWVIKALLHELFEQKIMFFFSLTKHEIAYQLRLSSEIADVYLINTRL